MCEANLSQSTVPSLATSILSKSSPYSSRDPLSSRIDSASQNMSRYRASLLSYPSPSVCNSWSCTVIFLEWFFVFFKNSCKLVKRTEEIWSTLVYLFFTEGWWSDLNDNTIFIDYFKNWMFNFVSLLKYQCQMTGHKLCKPAQRSKVGLRIILIWLDSFPLLSQRTRTVLYFPI